MNRIALIAVAVALVACSPSDHLRRSVGLGAACDTGDDCTGSNVCAKTACRTRCQVGGGCGEGLTCAGGACVPAGVGRCGDGKLDGDEGCDDGNTTSGDGCSSGCYVEAGSACVGEPSVCAACASGDPSECGLAFVYGDWTEFAACSSTCGSGTQARTRDCQLAGREVDCAECGGDCSESRDCADTSGCTFAYGDWSAWGTCDGNSQSRTRDCIRSDGAPADCASCGGDCTETRSCVNCSQYGLNAVNCGDQNACTALIAAAYQRCLGAGCRWTGPTECVVGGSVSSTSCYGATGTCE